MEASGSRIVTYPDKEAIFSIYDIADIHWLNRGISKPHLYRDIEKIEKDPYSLWTIGGDYCDWIFPGDKRWDPYAFDEQITVTQMTYIGALLAKKMISLFSPICSKGLGACIGNHELRYMTTKSEMFIHDQICRRLRIPNMLYCGWMDLYFVLDGRAKNVTVEVSKRPPVNFKRMIRVVVHHGFSAAATVGGKINALKKFYDSVIADLIMMAHLHDQVAKTFIRYTVNKNCTQLQERATMALITGTYLRGNPSGHVGYGETRGYSPTTLGATRARYAPSTGELITENRADNVGLKGNQ